MTTTYYVPPFPPGPFSGLLGSLPVGGGIPRAPPPTGIGTVFQTRLAALNTSGTLPTRVAALVATLGVRFRTVTPGLEFA